jgi:hypothetical protein
VSSRYPSPSRIAAPRPHSVSPDQKYHEGWEVNYSRMFVLLLISISLNVLQTVQGVISASRFRPAVQMVTLDGGYVVAWNDRGNAVIDEMEFVPARMREVVRQFTEGRYAYDYQNIQKMNNALRLMSPEAAGEERKKLEAIDLARTIIAPRMKVSLQPNLDELKITPQGKGRYDVTVTGRALINNATYPDPTAPMARPFSIQFTVQTVPSSDAYPSGLQIVSTGRDNILL